jgi:O-antigen ligase/polysaccharide polymerase Wzy-like membrane protein
MIQSLAFVGYLIFVASWFLHLPARVPILGALRIDLILAAVISGGAIAAAATPVHSAAERRVDRILIVLIAWAILSLPFVEWPGSVVRNGIPQLLKAVVFYYFTARLITTRRRIKQLLVVMVACQAIRVLEPLYLHVATGYWGSVATMADSTELNRLSGAPSDIINPNGLAFVILSVLPFLHFLGTLTRVGTVMYLSLGPCLLYALLLTGSRSGLLGLGIVVAGIWIKSRHKVAVACVLVAAACIAASTLSADLADRYRSIVSSETRNGATAQGRLAGSVGDLTVALRRPVFGHGLGTSLEVNVHFENGREQPSHILYGEIAQELGFVGVVIFVLFIAATAASISGALLRLKTANVTDGLLLGLGHSLQVWLWMDVLFSFASYGLTSYEWYLTAGFAAVLQNSVGPVARCQELPPTIRPARLFGTAVGPARAAAQPAAFRNRSRLSKVR